MTGTDKAQAHDAVAPESAAATASQARTGAFTLRAGTSQDATPTSKLSYPSPMSGLMQETADEREKQREERMSKMEAMMEKLTCELASERAANIQLPETIKAWEDEYPEAKHELYDIAEDDDSSVPGEYPRVVIPPGLPAEAMPYPTRSHMSDDWEEPEATQWSRKQYDRRDPLMTKDPWKSEHDKTGGLGN